MKFKLDPIEVPAEDPFAHDALSRRASVEALSNLVRELDGPFVLALNSPWGTGKSTYIRMLSAVLQGQDVPCLHFNAWDTDFAEDPLVAFLGELERYSSANLDDPSAVEVNLQKATRIAAALVRRAIPIAGKLATSGLLDLSAATEAVVSEFVGDAVEDVVDAYSAQRNLMAEFRSSLEQTLASVRAASQANQVVIFVDELDRCRPRYAIELLERIKHLFSVEGVVFILAIDKAQLDTSLGVIYGPDIDAAEYLKRFIDLEYMLAAPDADAFTQCLMERFELGQFFDGRRHPLQEFEKDNFKSVFVEMTRVCSLSLRAREQCVTRLRVAMMSIGERQLLFPILMAALIVLREYDQKLYREYAFGDGSSDDVVKALEELPGGATFLADRVGATVEGFLIAAKLSRFETSPEFARHEAIAAVTGDDRTAVHERSQHIVGLVRELINTDRRPALRYVVDRIELAARTS